MLNISAVECHDALNEMHNTIPVEGSRGTLSEILDVSAFRNDNEDTQQEITSTPGNVHTMFVNYDADQSSYLEPETFRVICAVKYCIATTAERGKRIFPVPKICGIKTSLPPSMASMCSALFCKTY